MKFFKNKKGFTLVELVVVIAILGILAGIAIPRFMDATATARGAKIVADLRTIDSAIKMYNAKAGALPTTTGQLTAEAPTATPPTYQLMASWPVPPAGAAKITNNSGVAKDYTPTAAVYAITSGRGTLDTKTVDDLLAL
ncbi:MAG: prepilin-type N-terminal cleavage/methylation domain-containing protein [Negativicutes bacterium]|nr:prepilin-type N-terminal cleavage/methylation domain-containing protein [Negativicutes bacterium]